ncbi:MAG: LptA/OstA family protein [Pseudomonadota bacterium]
MKLGRWALALGGFAASLAAAQTLPGTSIRDHDRNAEIVLDAGRIEVLDRQNQAIATGNVAVKQGNLDLDASRVRVFYDTVGGDVQVDRLDADGDVRIATPAENARSARAIYDVDSAQITMLGGVVLERGTDVLRGERLMIDLASGRSTFDAAVNAETGQPGRVTGRFTPSTRERE